MDYVVSHTKNNARISKKESRSRSPSPPHDNVRFSPTELPRRRSMEYTVDRSGGKSRVRSDFGTKSVSPSASMLRRRSKSIEVRASESSILAAHRQPQPLRRRSRSIELMGDRLNVSNSDRSTDDDGLKAPSRRRSRSIDMGTTSQLPADVTNSSRELLLAESGDDFMPLPSSSASSTTSTGFLHQKIPRRRGVGLGKAFSFRRNNKKFESLPDQGSGRNLAGDTNKTKNSDSSTTDSSSNTSSNSASNNSGNNRPISKQMSLRNLVDWRNSNNDKIGSVSAPGTPLAATNGLKSMDMSISDRGGAPIAAIPSISCIQLSFAGEAVMTQLAKADFSN